MRARAIYRHDKWNESAPINKGFSSIINFVCIYVYKSQDWHGQTLFVLNLYSADVKHFCENN